MSLYEVFTRDGETFLGKRWLWSWQAAELRGRGYIVVLW
jgi:hypothetical protein